jgi:DNA polymerase-3 subunit gamma/tau
MTDLDAKIRIATNQRLMVELALMKLCSLASPGSGDAEKKNFDRLAPEVSLPPLRGATQVTPKPVAVPAPAPEPEKSAPEPPKPAPEPVVAAPAFTGISGRSLAEIMSGPVATEAAQEAEIAVTPIDPAAQEKIERNRERFLERLLRERPRIGVAFETMEVDGNALKIRVASQTLQDEILRFRTETLHLLAAVAGVHGPIELEVIVDETVRPLRPIRLEDKVRHLADLNPEFNTLRKTLDMEVE